MGKDDPTFGDNLTRRQFVLASGAITFASLLPDHALGAEPVRRRVPAVQTWAAEDRAEVTVLSTQELRFEVSQGSGGVWIRHRRYLADQKRFLYHLGLSGLSADNYSQLLFFDLQGRQVDRRLLKGLDVTLTRPRIAVMSCSSLAHLKRQAQIWREVPPLKPDLIFFSGDIVYANSKFSTVIREPEKPHRALARYIQTWETVDLYQLETLIPLLAVWDDHDYGMNNGDASHPYKAEMTEIYRLFYPLPQGEDRLLPGEGVSFRAHFFGMDFYFLDNRSFAVPERTVWGEAQEAWFAEDYSSRPFPAWIVNGTCFLKYTRWIESVEKFARPSLERLRQLMKNKGKPCALWSGDIHASQVQRIPSEIFGFETYEFTSSAMHSTDAMFIHRRSPEDGQLFYQGSQNFLYADVWMDTNKMHLSVTCVTPGEHRPVTPSPLTISGL